MQQAQKIFSSCKNFALYGSKTGELIHSMCCVSMYLNHNTGMHHVNGKILVFYCKSCSFYQPRKSKDSDTTEPRNESGHYCPFYLRFVKRGELWYLKTDCELNSVDTRFCVRQMFPDFCVRRPFLVFLANTKIKANGKNTKIDAGKTYDLFNEEGLLEKSKRTLIRAVDVLNVKAAQKRYEPEQKIEDYVRHLNEKNQYAVLLIAMVN